MVHTELASGCPAAGGTIYSLSCSSKEFQAVVRSADVGALVHERAHVDDGPLRGPLPPALATCTPACAIMSHITCM